MKIIKLCETTERTWEALEELAGLTGIDCENRLGKLNQDMYSVYEWLIRHQAQGKIIAAIEPSDWEILKVHISNFPGNRAALVSLFEPEKIDRVLEYFKKAEKGE